MLPKVALPAWISKAMAALRAWVSKVPQALPFWQAMGCYSSDDKLKALPKFLVLWVMSLAPLFVAAILQHAPEHQSAAGVFFKKFGASFLARHQFIYAVSFITPIFYFFWERHSALLTSFLSGKRSPAGMKMTPPGFGVVLIWSTFFFLTTTVAYAVTEARSQPEKVPTILESHSETITLIVYAFGLLCWYFIILDGTASPVGNYYDQVKKEEEEEEKQAQDFSKRIATSGENEA